MNTTNATPLSRSHGFHHAEAFCHMTYHGQTKTGTITLNIWNSRDGVTPFITYCKEYGIELQHVSWQKDLREPGYKPKKGDLIWRSMTKEDAAEKGKKQFQLFKDSLAELEPLTDEEVMAKCSYDAKSHLKEIIDRGEEYSIQTMMENVERGEPVLELVKVDWPGAQESSTNPAKGQPRGGRFA